MENKKVWYAVVMDDEDNDHGYGSFDKAEAISMALKMRDAYPDAHVVAVNPEDDFCIDIIRDLS